MRAYGLMVLFFLAMVVAIRLVTDSGSVNPVPAAAQADTAEEPHHSTLPVDQPDGEPSEPATLQIQLIVAGLEEFSGTLRVAVFSGSDGFPRHENAVHQISVPVTGAEEFVSIPRLTGGSCAIAVYHDVDNNGRLNRAALGYPTEPYGFSNDARAPFGPPAWESARIRADGPEQTVSITVR